MCWCALCHIADVIIITVRYRVVKDEVIASESDDDICVICVRAWPFETVRSSYVALIVVAKMAEVIPYYI